MAFVVTESCIKCKYMDCVEVCPVDCFHEGPNFLVIDPDECIDCTLCEPECPVEAIFSEEEIPDGQESFLKLNAELAKNITGVNWNFSQNIRDNVMESLSGVKGDNSVKIFGPDLQKLERLANEVKARLTSIPGIANVGIFRVMGQPNLEIPVDPKKCN